MARFHDSFQGQGGRPLVRPRAAGSTVSPPRRGKVNRGPARRSEMRRQVKGMTRCRSARFAARSPFLFLPAARELGQSRVSVKLTEALADDDDAPRFASHRSQGRPLTGRAPFPRFTSLAVAKVSALVACDALFIGRQSSRHPPNLPDSPLYLFALLLSCACEMVRLVQGRPRCPPTYRNVSRARAFHPEQQVDTTCNVFPVLACRPPPARGPRQRTQRRCAPWRLPRGEWAVRGARARGEGPRAWALGPAAGARGAAVACQSPCSPDVPCRGFAKADKSRQHSNSPPSPFDAANPRQSQCAPLCEPLTVVPLLPRSVPQ